MKILVCSFASPGFLYPAIGLAIALRSRGHEVTFAADAECQRELARQALPRISRGLTDGSSFKLSTWANPTSVAMQVKHIERACALVTPDLIVGNALTFGPLLAGERLHVPVAILGFMVYLWPTRGSLERESQASMHSLRAWRHGDMIKNFNAARVLVGLPPVADELAPSPMTSDLYLLRSLPSLEPRAAQLPDRIRLVGPCLWEPEDPDSELCEWLLRQEVEDAPVLYVQHGRFFDTPSSWPAFVRAFAPTRFRIAASVGRMDYSLGDYPASWLVRPHIPQQQVLKRAMAAITTATTTAALGALSAGVPSLLIPSGGEQPDVAEACVRAGAARAVSPSESSIDRLTQELHILLGDECYRMHARQLADEMARIDGFGEGATLIDSILLTSHHNERAACQTSS